MRLVTSIVVVLLAAGCAQLGRDQPAPVVRLKNAAQKLMSVDCSGPANDWGVCYSAAGKSCPNGYDVIDKQESTAGGQRVLGFQCK
jgi:hypothetical protein